LEHKKVKNLKRVVYAADYLGFHQGKFEREDKSIPRSHQFQFSYEKEE
jgi:hypothetical protein